MARSKPLELAPLMAFVGHAQSLVHVLSFQSSGICRIFAKFSIVLLLQNLL